MHQKQAFQTEHKGGCGSMGRGKFSSFWAGPTFGRQADGYAQPPVNIEETDADYIISLVAAGLVKEQVTLTVKDDVLRIAYPGADADTPPGTGPESNAKGNFTYQEYKRGPFSRSFRLNDKVFVDRISASYADGILTVVLPKNPATNIPAQTITVA